jgi:Holliday junction resolvasome RuvABC endonuclease subunit
VVIVLGIDPGTANTGFDIVRRDGRLVAGAQRAGSAHP